MQSLPYCPHPTRMVHLSLLMILHWHIIIKARRLHRFEQMYNDRYHKEYFHCPVLCLFTPPPRPFDPATTNLLLQLPWFRHSQNIIQVEPYSMLSVQIDFFHLATCPEASSMPFYGLIVHFFLVLSNIPLSDVAVHPSCPRCRTSCFWVLAIMTKAARNVCVQVSLWTEVSNSFA